MSSHRAKVKSCLAIVKSSFRSFSKSFTALTAFSLAMSASLAFAQSATTTSLSVTPISAANGSVLAMTATVKAGATPVSGGVVTFLDTYNSISRVLGSVQVQSVSGTAVLQQEFGGVGSHSIMAVFGAIQAYSSSSDVQSVTITGTYPTTTSLVQTSAGTTPPFSLTATVTGTGSTNSFPVGNISLLDTSNANYLIVTPPPALGAGVSGQQTVAGSTSPVTVGSGPQSIASGDFNGDGFIDLAVLNSNDRTVWILFGDGAGGFTASPTKLTTGNGPVAIVAADFNQDGKLDLAVVNSADGAVAIYLGGINGTFSAPSTYSIPGVFLEVTTPTSLVVGDFDGDGKPDLAVAQSATLLDLVPVNGVVDIMLGDGSGAFPAANVSQVNVGTNPTAIVAGYFNAGGNLDFAVTNKSSNTISVMLGNGNGSSFTQATGSPISTGNGTAPNSLVAADINGDGKLDLAVTYSSTKKIGIFRGNGAGAFAVQATLLSTGTTPTSIVAGDFNADGNVDLAVANSGQTTASLFLGNGDFTFQTPTTPTVAKTPIAVASADFNGDGTSDLAIANNGSKSVSILLNQVTDTASVSFTGVTIPGSGNHNILASFPTNLDFAASKSATLSLAATKISTSTLLSATNSAPAFGQQIVITAMIQPSLVGALTPGGTVTFKDNGNTLGTAITVSGGVATLSTASLTIGVNNITASYSGDTNFVASAAVTPLVITVGPATPVIIWATPAAISYGTLLSSTQLNATTTAPGTFSYNPAPYTLLAVGNYTLTATFTPSNTNYTPLTTTVTLTVNPANPQISWPSPAAITYPTPLSNIQLDATVAVYTPVPLTSYYNINAIYSNGTHFASGFDQSGNAYSSNLLGTSVTWNNITYQLGPANALDGVAGLSSTGTTVTIPLPAGYYASLNMLGAMVNNTTAANPFIITYTDGTTSTYTQSLSDWVYPLNWPGETEVTCVPFRNTSTGGQDAHLTCVYGYQIPLNSSKIVQSVTLPAWQGPGDVSILAMDLVSPPVPGALVYNPALGAVLPTGENTLSATFTPTDQTDYTGASASVQLLVNPSNATTLVWPTPAPIVYGTALSATQLNAVAQTTPGTTSVSLSSYYRVNAFETDGSTFSTGGFDNGGNAYSATLLGSSVVWNGQTYALGPANVPDAVTSTTIALPQGNFVSLSLIGAATTGGQTAQPFTITYTDGTTATTKISLSSWLVNQGYPGESFVAVTGYYNNGSGGRVTGQQADLYGYQIALDNTRTVQSITLPNNRNVVIVAMGLNTSSTPTVVPGTYAYTPAAGVVPAVGTIPLKVVFTPTNPNFGTATKTVNLVVTKQALLFTANNETVVYGTAVPPYTYSVTGYVNGDTAATAFTGNPSLTTTPAAPTAAGTYTITPATGSLASSNYSLTFATGSLTITKATPGINWSNPANITYGTALVQSSTGQLNATVSGSIPGTFSYSPAAGTVLPAGPQTLTVTFTPTDTTDYTTATASVQIIVNQRNLTVTASSYTIPYGTADPAYAATITGFATGDTQANSTTGTPSLTTNPAAPSAPNTYTITAAPGTLASTNYTFTYAPGTLTITKGTLTVTAGNATRVYGSANPTFSATATGAVNSDTFTFAETTTATATSPVGPYNIVPTASGTNLANYNVTYINGTLTVTKAPLVVTASSYTIPYGTADPTYAATITGFVNGDTTATATTGTPSLTTTPAAPSAPNTYTITAAPGTLASTNYSFTYVAGSLTITKGTLTVTAGNATRVYGAANPTFTASATGAMNGDSFTFSETTAATATSPVGPYNIVPTASGTNLANYNVVYVNGTLTVTAANLTVTASSYTIPYGTADPAYTATITGFVNGDTAATATTGTPSLTTNPAAPSAPNTYTITAAPGTLASTNYTFTYAPGTLTITKGTLTVTAGNATRVYGQANPPFTASATGAVNGDSFTFSETTTATATSPAGPYNIVPTASGTNLANYNVVYINGTLTVTKASLTVTANSYTIPYGTTDPTYTATITGFVNGDTTATATTGTPSLTTTPAAPSAANTYTITAAAGTLASTNYTFTYAPGTLTITKGTLTVTAGNATRAYGAANPTFSATATGAASGDTFTFSETTTATTTSPAGTYNIVPTASGTNIGNYNVVYVNGTLTVTAVNLTVTANSYTITYGTADPTYTATITGFVNGDTAASATTGAPSLTTTPAAPAAANTYTITAAPGTLASTNYTFTYVNGSLTINKGSYTITWASQSIVYGTAIGGATGIKATASIPGSFSYSPAGVLPVGPAVTVTATFTPTDTTDYAGQTASAQITVTPAVLTVTANNATRAYGQADPTYTDSITGLVNGDTLATAVTGSASLTSSDTATSPVGSYPITAAAGTLAAKNYTFLYAPGTLTITQATGSSYTITWASQSIVYGTAIGGATGIKATASIPGSFSYSPAGVLPVGPAVTVTATFTPTDTTDYAGQTASAQITVTPAVLTVTANNATRAYGQADPTYTDSITGLVNGDTLATAVTGAASLTSTDTATSPVGSYPITAAAGTLAAKNYTFTFNPGTLTITQATGSSYTITWANQSIVYGTAIGGATGIKATASIPGSFSYSPAGVLPVGPAVTVTATFTPTDTTDYAGQTASAQITVTPAVLTVTASNATRAFGQADPTYTDSITGLVNGDTLATAVTGSASLTSSDTATSPVGSYPITAAAGTLAAKNYTFLYAPGTLTITQATGSSYTITWANQSIVYGTAIGGATGIKATASIPGSFSYSPAGVLPVGPAVTVTATFTPTDTTDYAGQTASAQITVTPAVLTVTANNATRAYGQADPTYTDSITGLVNGDTLATAVTGSASLTSTDTATSPVGSYPITAAAGTLAAKNYTFLYAPGTLTITQATGSSYTITWANQSIVYGTAIGGTTGIKATASIPGSFSYSPAGVLPVGPAVSVTATFTPTDTTDYAGQTASAQITVTPAVLTVTASNVTRAYGAADPAYTDSITGLVNGDTLATAVTGSASLTSSDTATSPVGSYPITAAAGTLAAKNYTFTFNPGTLTITQATGSSYTITWANQSIVYGTAIGGATGIKATASIPGSFSYSPAGVLPVGPAVTVTATFTPTDTTDYAGQTASAQITVTPAVLTVTANNATRAYGQADPTYTDSITGLVNGDTLATAVTGAASLTSTDTATSPVGSYPITAAAGTLAAKNYTFTYNPGTLTITQATGSSYTITWASQSIVYGTAIGGATGIKATASIPGSFSYSPAGVLPVGPAVTVTATFTPTDTTDYAGQTASAQITVTPAVLTVTANNATRAYGQADPTYTDSITGLVNGDTLATAVTGSASLTSSDTATSPVGSYPITAAAGTLAAKNYTFLYAPGTLTITQATGSSYTITWASQSIVYGTAIGGATGIKATASIPGSFSYSPAGVLPVGPAVSVTATFTPTDTTDYAGQTASAQITVTPAVLTVTANNATRAYGQADPTYTDSITGLVNGDTLATAVTGSASLTSSDTATSPVGSYPITAAAGTLAAKNYTFLYAPGTLTITQATGSSYTITWANQSIVYGTAIGGATGIKATASIPGSFSYSPAGVLPVGPAVTVTATFTPTDTTDYAGQTASAQITVTPAVLTVTASNATRAYGQADPTYTDSITGLVNGDTLATAVTGAASLTSTDTATSPGRLLPHHRRRRNPRRQELHLPLRPGNPHHHPGHRIQLHHHLGQPVHRLRHRHRRRHRHQGHRLHPRQLLL
ncbi:MBG domain-containing protein [Tunturiibacter empetritectus]